MTAIKTLLIDNFDSYTYNLYQLIAVVNGVPPVVVLNNEITLNDVRHMVALGAVDNIVISPGPGNPYTPGDIGVVMKLLKEDLGVPILGVCLGMQALAVAHGGAVGLGPEPVHGRVSTVQHTSHPLFAGIPSGAGAGFEVVRYHSLAVSHDGLPACLTPIAWTCGGHHAVTTRADGAAHGRTPGPASQGCGPSAPGRSSEEVLMALAHAARPLFGVQFHPESVATTYGARLIENFRNLTLAHCGTALPAAWPAVPPAASPSRTERAEGGAAAAPALKVCWQCLRGALADIPGGSEALFWGLYGRSRNADVFWLDSAAVDRGRFSYMGGPGGPLWRALEYRLPKAGAPSVANPGMMRWTDSAGNTSEQRCTLFNFLEDLLREHCVAGACGAGEALPFDFWGGLVGYLGYELKAEAGAACTRRAATPDAALFLADRLTVVDHHTDDVFAVSLNGGAPDYAAASWVAEQVVRIEALRDPAPRAPRTPDQAPERDMAGHAECYARPRRRVSPPPSPIPAQRLRMVEPCRGAAHAGPSMRCVTCQAASLQEGASRGEVEAQGVAPFRLRQPKSRYMEKVAACKAALHAGESYELCLTTALVRGAPPNPAELYSHLRRLNPAPYGAYLSFGSSALHVCCSSPERFLRGSRGGLLEARPIKGTAPRSMHGPAADAAAAAALAASEKDRAENLMIVDLLRNDLGRVCEEGSVTVPGLMDLESFATVHQLVSTVRGQRKPGSSIVDCLRATFPGGSMTGAPKLRSMEILDRMEKSPRGVYSGSIGFIGFNDTFDLNIVIRTAVIHDNTISIGAGGAIVLQSDTLEEYEEMRLKANALLKAVGRCDGSEEAAQVDEHSAC